MHDYREMFALAGKTALVIGPNYEGIGHAQALGLAQFGADVLVAGENVGDLNQVAAEIIATGRRSAVLHADVTSEDSVRSMVKAALSGFGRIDILINDFSTRLRKPATDFPVSEWQKVMDYNTRGCFICCKEVGAEMVKNRSGKIINHSSVRAQYGFPGGYAAYSASKGAIDALTKTLATEWAPYNVFVNAIAPTFLKPSAADEAFSEPDEEFVRLVLSRIPLGRLGEPQDFVGPALFLASSASDFFTGHTLFVDGGVTSW
jgi:NAD(P)-dependent dehydrogenase (short-subunit alcohol dehydrogenase family)